jgi:hypothetical protein
MDVAKLTMAYDPQSPPKEKSSVFGVIVHSFFVVPFLLAVFSILLFAAVRILTMEKHSWSDYLGDIKSGGATKRWQAAFELSRVLSNPKAVPNDPKFVSGLKEAYEASFHDDDRVRQYLVMAMARTGNPEFASVLRKKIDQEKDENLYASINALGILKDKSAIPVLLKYVHDNNPRIRLAAVIALGNTGDISAVPALKQKLNDPEPNVTWDAAIALAKLGDRSGKDIILKLLDRNYLNGFLNLGPQQKSHIMQVAMQASAPWVDGGGTKDRELQKALQYLFDHDPNMNVRSIAHKVLTQPIQ